MDSFTPLLTAVSYGCKEAMKELLDNKASVDAIDRDGKSMIFKAAEENRHEVLKVLHIVQYMYIIHVVPV